MTPRLNNKMVAIGLACASLLACTASLAADDMELLDSLLARGLIAQSDYNEQKAVKLRSLQSQTLRPLPADQVTPSAGAPVGASAARSASLPDQILLASNERPSGSGKSSDASSAAGHGGNHFAGAYVVLSNEWKRGSVKVDGEKISKSEAAPSFGVGYTFAINDSYTLGLKASMDIKSGEYGAGEVTSRSGETKVTEKSHYSLALEPGYVVSDKTLVFGILAYHTAKAEIEEASGSARLHGIGYGIGFKQSLGDHLFLTGEIQHVDYSSKTVDGSTLKPASTTGSVGVGYHF